MAQLKHHIRVLEKIAFGKSSERRTQSVESVDPAQGHLFAALLAEAEGVADRAPVAVDGEIEVVSEGRPRKKAKRRSEFPDHLPVFKTTYALPESERICLCGCVLAEIGESCSRELERVEVTIVHEIARKRYACKACGAMAKTAPGPDRVLPGSLLGPGFMAHALVERFLNHMPYHRQEQKYESEGLAVSRTVLERTASRCAELLAPIVEQIKRDVLGSGVIFTDDTPVTIAQDSRGHSRQARIWTYCDREGRIFYDFTETRKRDGPLAVLKDFEGYVHADAYPGYDPLYLPGGAREVACMAHARRKILSAENEEPKLVEEGLGIVRALYRVEADAKNQGLAPDAVLALRHERSKRLFESLAAWMDRAEVEALPKGALGSALGYLRRQWKALQTYLEDGRLEIDNNRAERALRPFAVGRKNWLFFLTPQGGRNAAVLMSLVRTAKEAGLDPRIYLRDVLLRIAHESDVSKLTPHGWKHHFADQVARDLRGTAKVIVETGVGPAVVAQ